MKLITALRLAATGLSAERVRLNVASMNIANAHVTRTLDGGPYRAKNVVMAASPFEPAFERDLRSALSEWQAPEVIAITDDQSPFHEVYDPTHPDADERGIVRYPNVDVLTEMVDLMAASRAYEANLSVVTITKSMALKTIDILR
ncbi:MAG: flagellar basal body rod protein FlgC [Thermodesulfobacteria bacterium]|nr:flagellar basal body rod protein FlgC [Thermodesulfobacteriota bacterium]